MITIKFSFKITGFSLKIAVVGQKGITSQENILKEVPRLNKR